MQMTFDFPPDVVFYIAQTLYTNGSGGMPTTGMVDKVICQTTYRGTRWYQYFGFGAYQNVYGRISADGATVEWYSNSGASPQYNESNITYWFLAIA